MATTFPNSPRLFRGALVLLDPDNGRLQRIITLQFNPETLTRTLQVQSVQGEGGDRIEALRLTGPPVETIKLDAEIDATEQLELPAQNPTTALLGIHPQLAALESMVYPSSSRIQRNNSLAQAGTLEIIPAESSLTLFVWSASRILPVRVTEYSITEEFFDKFLNPIRAKVSLGMRVLNVNDLPFTHRGNNLFMIHHQLKERLAQFNQASTLSAAVTSAIR
ncbi:hypothetical protein L0337_42450 [candidate division KSB1 bacterium]|nr:hypothetical protein [candidate division KSB1 bacterium]